MGGDRRPTAAEDGMAVFSVTINVDKRRSPPHFDFRGQESATIYVRVARRDPPNGAPMPRARHGRLTDTFIESLLPQEGGRERIVRDGAIPGFLIRVGLRKRTFELRIEKPPKITVPLGRWPDLCAVEARRKAEDLWDKHRKGEALDDRPPRDDETIATTWPRFKKRLEDDGRSERTIEGYGDVFKRLSERVNRNHAPRGAFLQE